jgi:hypothetical protein
VRIDSASGVSEWAQDAEANQRKIVETFTEACAVARGMGERLAAEGEICWGGMHSWKKMLDLLERVDQPDTLGFQADMAHTLLYILGYNAAEDAILPPDWDWSEPRQLDNAMKTLTTALRPWTIDFHVAQNDATVKGSGTHDKTGHHCLPNDPNGKLNIPHHAGYWLHGPDGKLTKAIRHICWDGCMFPNAVMMRPETWNSILASMIAVRDAHGWREEPGGAEQKQAVAGVSSVRPKRARARSKPARKTVRSRPAARRAKAKPTAKKKAARAKARKPAPAKRAAKKRPAKKKAKASGRGKARTKAKSRR